jgi:uncharacterized protein (UPF0210 family)
MKIRTITAGFNYNTNTKEKDFKKIGDFLNKIKKFFENNNYKVQTLRASTQSWDNYFESRNQIIKLVKNFEKYSEKYNIDYFCIGPTYLNENISVIYDIIKNTSIGFCTTHLSNGNQINHDNIEKTSKLIKSLSKINCNGFANLRFAALFNVKPGCPFYPSSFHNGKNKSFSIGLENSDLVYKAFSESGEIKTAGFYLNKILTNELKKIEDLCEKISLIEKIKYGGIDPSISPSVNQKESIAYAFEKLGIDKFGNPGTLNIARIITDIIKNLNIKKCGYCGLMLPVLEDFGLSERNNEGTFNIYNLLLYSAVCGIGLDTIPLPGNVSEKKLYSLLLDIASLSNRLDKPLSARLMPIPNKKYGDMTDYRFGYFVNSKLMDI